MTAKQTTAAVQAAIGVDEILLAVALVLVTIGLWPLCGQVALVAPGLVGLYVALPCRQPFISRPTGLEETRKC